MQCPATFSFMHKATKGMIISETCFHTDVSRRTLKTVNITVLTENSMETLTNCCYGSSTCFLHKHLSTLDKSNYQEMCKIRLNLSFRCLPKKLRDPYCRQLSL